MSDFNTYSDAGGTERHFGADGAGTSESPTVSHHRIKDSAGGEPIGTTTTTAVTSDSNGSVIGFLRGLVKWAYERMPASLGQKTMANSLSVTVASDQTVLATSANQSTELTRLGDVTETAPASDTASSGLNGRLQRIAQRLTSLIGLLPTSLGQKSSANSFAVVLPSDQTISAGTSFYSYHINGAELGASPTTSYAVGDAVGGLVEMTNISNNKAARLDSLTLQAASVGTGTWSMTVMFFGAEPASSTFTDDAGVVIDASDKGKLKAYVKIVDADWETIDNKKFFNVGNIGKVVPASGGSIWLAIRADAIFDGPANDLEVSVGWTQD